MATPSIDISYAISPLVRPDNPPLELPQYHTYQSPKAYDTMDPASEPTETPDPENPQYTSFVDKGIPPPPTPAPAKEGPSCAIAHTTSQPKVRKWRFETSWDTGGLARESSRGDEWFICLLIDSYNVILHL